MAYPAFRSAGAVSGTTGTSITPALPTGWQIDDICFLSLFVYDLGGAPSFNVPAGWSLAGSILQNTSGSEHFHHEVYWRRMQSGDAAPNVTVTAASVACYAGTISAYSACTTSGTPYENVVTNIVPRTTTADGTAVTTSGAERLAVQLWASDDNATSTPPSGWTERQDAGTTSGSDAQFAIDTQQVATATTLTRADRTAFSTTSLGTSVVGLALIPVSSSGVTGTLGVTIDPVTQSTAANLLIQGSAAQTISAVTQSATGKVLVQGALAATIDAVTLAASGGSAVAGTFAQTIDAVTLSAAGQVLVQGSLARTIDNVTQAATGHVVIAGTLASTIDPVTQAATGAVIIQGSFAQTIDAVTLAASGTSTAVGNGALNSTLDAVTQAASGQVIISGSLAETIAPVTQSAAGALVIKGSFGKTIDPVTLAASGSADLPAIEGTFGQVIDAVTLFAAATISQPAGAGGTPYWGPPGGHIPRDQLARAVKALLRKKKRRKPVELAKALIAAAGLGALDQPERKAVVAEVAKELPLQLPALFTQARIDDAAAVQAAIARILIEAVARATDEDEEDIEWLLMAA